jgi:hypothetical protein
MSFVEGVLMLVTRNVAVSSGVLATSDALSFAGFIESLLVTSGVF